ncbi:aldo/keto reductase [Acetobacter fallax]|uniref:Aldo/keto reductase n=1 Tax=Acetobacter fallax TaxID=1737473 RepID=A0ABX0KE21_9PROT|nr:aldo/keto reductase [Acetobacter fallax]NHO33363.1 aldo/keto reductase [Acetobacter fallax]NHO36983.1 aldo/keto reductase [Acetobacter fallax]
MSGTVKLRSGTEVPALGMGTWNMGDNAARRSEELESLRTGIDLGLRVIDTAEMYGNGRSENVVGEAIAGIRDKVYLVTKVVPSNASRKGVLQACRNSLDRLKTDRIDLYLLHWRGSVPLSETIEAFEQLRDDGLIGSWGVSNFDVDDMRELDHTPGGDQCEVNQILYSLDHRGVEFDLLHDDRKRHVATMAYSPIGQGGVLLRNEVLATIAHRHKTSLGAATPAQIALAWVLRQPDLIAIPKASSVKHLRENVAAREIKLSNDDLAALDRAFAPPTRHVSLEMI